MTLCLLLLFLVHSVIILVMAPSNRARVTSRTPSRGQQVTNSSKRRVGAEQNPKIAAKKKRMQEKVSSPEVQDDSSEEEDDEYTSRKQGDARSDRAGIFDASPRNNTSPTTMNSIMHPNGQNQVTPSDPSPTDVFMQSVVELNNQAVTSRETWVASDIEAQA